MKAPQNIYLPKDIDLFARISFRMKQKGDVEYIRKDISNEAIQVAEDHAYFAGQEKFREKLLVWAKEVHDSGPIKDSADKGDAWSIGYLCGMKDIIDKLNAL